MCREITTVSWVWDVCCDVYSTRLVLLGFHGENLQQSATPKRPACSDFVCMLLSVPCCQFANVFLFLGWWLKVRKLWMESPSSSLCNGTNAEKLSVYVVWLPGRVSKLLVILHTVGLGFEDGCVAQSKDCSCSFLGAKFLIYLCTINLNS